MASVNMKPISEHDDCQLLTQPISAYDLQVRYNKIKWYAHSQAMSFVGSNMNMYIL